LKTPIPGQREYIWCKINEINWKKIIKKMNKILNLLIVTILLFSCTPILAQEQTKNLEIIKSFNNPIITGKFTADPAALVHKDKVYLYTGHDEAPNDFHFYKMNEWLVFSSSDMVSWKEHPVPLKISDFKWAKSDAWAAQVIERDGKFFWYVSLTHGSIDGKAIGVAVADNPTGPFKDALGKALVTNDMTTEYTDISWDDIDPTVFIDIDGQAYLYWGNTVCYYAKLKDNMIELDGTIHTVELPNFTEAPWIHKKGDWYYLSYAYGFPEKIAYAMSKSVTGPWEFKGILNELAGNSNTNHQSIIEFMENSYFIYHTGGIQPNGGSFRRSVSIDRLYYNPDGTLKRMQMTSEGIQK
jgi:beta-xylosidase